MKNIFELYNGNFTKEHNIVRTLEDIEECITRIDYLPPPPCDHENPVERMSIPMVADSFYSYLFEYDTIPSKEELVKKYLQDNSEELYKVESVIGNVGNPQEHKSFMLSLLGRLYRTYPSLIRDYHCYIMLYYSKMFDWVWYSTYNDTMNGVDIMVGYRGKKIGLNLFIGTPRSMEYRKLKKDRHPQSDFDMIDVALTFSSVLCQKLGNIYTYSKAVIPYIISKIEIQSS